jgi:hypothetical protein
LKRQGERVRWIHESVNTTRVFFYIPGRLPIRHSRCSHKMSSLKSMPLPQQHQQQSVKNNEIESTNLDCFTKTKKSSFIRAQRLAGKQQQQEKEKKNCLFIVIARLKYNQI